VAFEVRMRRWGFGDVVQLVRRGRMARWMVDFVALLIFVGHIPLFNSLVSALICCVWFGVLAGVVMC